MRHFLLVCGLALAAAGGMAAADDKKTGNPLEAIQKAAMPGPFHKKLDPLAGSWTWTSKFWFEPGKPPMDGSGTAERKWILGDRFLEEHVAAKEILGQPFQGFGLTGYDNLQKKYQSVWTDTMTTTLSHSTGSVDEAGKVFTFQKEETDPFTGKKVKGRDVIHILDANKHTMEMFKGGPDGKEIKVMEITFVRKAK